MTSTAENKTEVNQSVTKATGRYTSTTKSVNNNDVLLSDPNLLHQPVSVHDIHDAARRIDTYVHKTPMMTSQRIDKMAGRKLFFKCELLQRTGSFKIRGATNAICKLLEEHPGTPCVATYSTGNHGLAVAYAAQQLGLDAFVVLPNIAPMCKQTAIEEYGAVKILCEPSEQDLEAQKSKVVADTGAVYIPPSQHYDVIAGQGTVATEILQQVIDMDIGKLDAIVVPVGGGGLLAGICIAVKSLQRDIKVIGAEPKLADDCYQSFHARQRLPLSKYPDTIADGLKVNVGPVAWPIIRDLVDDVVVVSEEEIKNATRLIWNVMKLCIEPSAGVGLAAVLSADFKHDYKNVAVILCGGNVDLANVSKWI